PKRERGTTVSLLSRRATGGFIMRSFLHRIACWLARKTATATVRNSTPERPSFVDAYRRLRTPSAHDLLAELKNTAYACPSLNAAVCATFAPRLFVSTRRGEAAPRCLTRALPLAERRELLRRPELAPRLKGTEQVEEVLDHPLLSLFRAVNPTHNAHDLWELTALYQEVHGSAYWHLSFDTLGVPDDIRGLP